MNIEEMKAYQNKLKEEHQNKYGVYCLVFGIDDYIKSDSPLFAGSREECIKWVKQNQYNAHGDIIYDNLTIELIEL